MRSPDLRCWPRLALSAVALLTACHETTEAPVEPPAPPTSAPTTPPAPPTVAPPSRPPPDAGFNIVAGAPVIVAEAPTSPSGIPSAAPFGAIW